MLASSPFSVSVEALQTILDALPSPVFVKDREHRFVVANHALCKLMGRSHAELLNNTDAAFIPAEQKEVFWRMDDTVFATGEPKENEEVITDGTGALRVIVTRKCLIKLPTSEGEEPFLIGVISDVTRFREAEARARYLAEHDPLTGLANRMQMSAQLAVALEVALKSDSKVALLLLDLDGFKEVNDQYGHPVGDELLRVIAKRLARLVRNVDTVVRLGGDEFCIVQTGLQQPNGAFGLADRIVSAVALPVVLGASRMSVSASIGIAVFPDDGRAPEALLQKADMALYAVKRKGRNGYLRYVGAAAVARAPDWDVETDLRNALARDQLWLAFQPLAAAAGWKRARLRGSAPLATSRPRRRPVRRLYPGG